MGVRGGLATPEIVPAPARVSPRMHIPHLGIRARLLLLGILPAALVLAAVLGLVFLRMRDVMIDFGKDNLLEAARAVAADIDRGNLEAVTAARTLAVAVETGLLGRRAELLRLTRQMLATNPQFTGVYVGLEPDADGLDAAAPGDLPAAAHAPDGRFIPYWGRDRADPARLTLTPLERLDGLYYAGCRERFLDPTQADKAMITEPYDYEGVLMVEQTYPIAAAGRFLGVAGVDRTLDRLAADLDALRARERRSGRHVEIVLVSRLGRVIASTVRSDELRARPIAESPYAAIVGDFQRSVAVERVTDGVDPLTGSASLYAAERIPTGDWTLVMQMPRADLVRRVQGPLAVSAGLATAGIAAAFGLMAWLAGRIAGRIERAVAAARRVAQGDLAVSVVEDGSDETGQLLRDVGGMTASLRAIVTQVKQTSVDLNATARQVSAASRQQEGAIASLGASTTEAAAASRQISATGRELLVTMGEVADVAAATARVADDGRESLVGVGESMEMLEQATATVAERLAAIRQRAEDINEVITTITKVADQTNLLSINAAIEAEKAGPSGRGFLVVAGEVRRLADQTAVAALDIERLVEQMQQAVAAGVAEMDRFAREVATGVGRVGEVSTRFADVIGQVHGLNGRFEQVKEGMHAQATGAQQITEALATLTDGSLATADALREFKSASQHMVTAVDGLSAQVGRFRIEQPGSA
jgi:methyl-accepting chemotaxis protein